MVISLEELASRWKEAQSLPDWTRTYILQGLLDDSLIDAQSGLGYNTQTGCFAPTEEQLAPTKQAIREALSAVGIALDEESLSEVAGDWNVGIMHFSQCLRVRGII